MFPAGWIGRGVGTVWAWLESIFSTANAAFPAHCRSPRASLAGSYVLVKISRDKKSAKIDFAFCIFSSKPPR